MPWDSYHDATEAPRRRRHRRKRGGKRKDKRCSRVGTQQHRSEPEELQTDSSDSGSAENSAPITKPGRSKTGRNRWTCAQGCGKRSNKCLHNKVLTYFPSTEEKARQKMLEQERKAAGADREERRQEWLAEELVMTSPPDWQDDQAGWVGVSVPTGWSKQQYCKTKYVIWRWSRESQDYWYSFEQKGYRGVGTVSKTWLRARLAQVQWKEEHCPGDDIATEEEDELLDMMHANQERADRFSRELNASDSEGDRMNVHKYDWGCPDGHICEYWSQLEEQDREFQQQAEQHSRELEACNNLGRTYEQAVESSMGSSEWAEKFKAEHRGGSPAECLQSSSDSSNMNSEENHRHHHTGFD
jgi:hypothetical protein